MATMKTSIRGSRASCSSSSFKPFAAPAASPLRPQPRRDVHVARAEPSLNGQSEKALFGENFGARDATAGELASNFSDKVLSHADTAHIIKIPAKTKLFVGIGAQSIKPTSELQLLQGKEFDLVKNQVPGWRVTLSAAGQQSLRQEWKGKDAAAAAQIAKQLQGTAEGDGYTASVSVEGETVSVELATKALGGLTVNDFIVASRMNDVDVKDLLAKKKARFWA